MADRIRIDYSTHTAAGCLLEEARPPAYLKIINKNDDDDCYHCHCIYIINRKETINVFVLTTFDSLRTVTRVILTHAQSLIRFELICLFVFMLKLVEREINEQ